LVNNGTVRLAEAFAPTGFDQGDEAAADREAAELLGPWRASSGRYGWHSGWRCTPDYSTILSPTPTKAACLRY